MKKTRIILTIDCVEEEGVAGVTAQSIMRDHAVVLEWARDITGDYEEAVLYSAEVSRVWKK